MVAIKDTNFNLYKQVASGSCNKMKVVVDWFFDESRLIHLIYVNKKCFLFGAVADINASSVVTNIQKFCSVAEIDIEVKRHDWSYDTDPNPIKGELND